MIFPFGASLCFAREIFVSFERTSCLHCLLLRGSSPGLLAARKMEPDNSPASPPKEARGMQEGLFQRGPRTRSSWITLPALLLRGWTRGIPRVSFSPWKESWLAHARLSFSSRRMLRKGDVRETDSPAPFSPSRNWRLARARLFLFLSGKEHISFGLLRKRVLPAVDGSLADARSPSGKRSLLRRGSEGGCISFRKLLRFSELLPEFLSLLSLARGGLRLPWNPSSTMDIRVLLTLWGSLAYARSPLSKKQKKDPLDSATGSAQHGVLVVRS